MRVLVTRPQPGADATARRLAALGHEAIVLPLTRTEPLHVENWPDGPHAAVVATSAAAIRHAPDRLVRTIRDLPLHAVGRATAAAAREAGFGAIAEPFIDADDLAAHLPARLPGGAHLLYLTGRLRTGAVATRLEAAGLRVAVAEVYDTVADEAAFAGAANALGQDGIDAALVHSAYGAAMLSRLAQRHREAFAAMRILCISERVREALDPALRAGARVAASPDEAALLALVG
jgi:uroporphyrinogen-III synthase